MTAPVVESINRWVETQTRDRIKDLIPAGLITRDTRLVLANAIYLKAAWAEDFQPEPRMPFRVGGKQTDEVRGLFAERAFGHRKLSGGSQNRVESGNGVPLELARASIPDASPSF